MANLRRRRCRRRRAFPLPLLKRAAVAVSATAAGCRCFCRCRCCYRYRCCFGCGCRCGCCCRHRLSWAWCGRRVSSRRPLVPGSARPGGRAAPRHVTAHALGWPRSRRRPPSATPPFVGRAVRHRGEGLTGARAPLAMRLIRPRGCGCLGRGGGALDGQPIGCRCLRSAGPWVAFAARRRRPWVAVTGRVGGEWWAAGQPPW